MRFFQSLQNDGISAPAQIRLLNNTFLRLVFSFSAVPFVGIPFAIWIYMLGDDLGPTIIWIIIYLLCAVAIRLLHRCYQREAKTVRGTSCDAGFRVLIILPLFTGWEFLHSI